MSGSDRQQRHTPARARDERPFTVAERKLVDLLIEHAMVPAPVIGTALWDDPDADIKLIYVAVTKLRRKLARHGIPLGNVTGEGWCVAAQDRKRLSAVLKAAPPPWPGDHGTFGSRTAPAAAQAAGPRVPIERRAAESALGARVVREAERLRAKKWSVKGIARHLGVPVAPVKALFGVTGEV